MTQTVEHSSNPEGRAGLIFLPGVRGPIDVSGNPARELSRLEFALLDTRGVFSGLSLEEQIECFGALRAHKLRILGGNALATSVEI